MLNDLTPTIETRPLEERSTFTLDGDGVVSVATGRIDVFVAERVDGKPIGRRDHLLRVEEGEVLMHMGAAAQTDRWSLIAVGTGETTVQVLGGKQVRAWGQTPETHRRAARLIERWVQRLTEAVTDLLPEARPDDATDISPDGETPLPPRTAAQPEADVAWLRCANGSVRYMTTDADASAIPIDVSVPVAKPGWIFTEEVSSVIAVSADQVNGNDLWAGLDLFHRHIHRRLDAVVRERKAGERDRLTDRIQSRRSALGNAFGELAAVIGERPAAHAMPDDGDPYFAAAQRVGKALQISVRRSSEHDAEAYDRAPLQAIARASGIQTRKVALRGAWWREDNGPLYASVEDDGRPVALLSPSPGRYEMHDPTHGTVTPVDDEVAGMLHPFGYTLYRALPQRKLTARDIFRFGVETCRRDLWMIILMAAGSGLLSMAPPIVTGMIFQDVIPGAERGQLLQLTAALLVAAVVAATFRFTQSLAIIRVQGNVSSAVQSAVWDRLLSLPLSFFRSFSSGDLAMRAMGFSQMQRQLSGPVVTGLLGGIFSSFNFFLLFYYSPYLAKWATLLAAIALVMTLGGNILQIRFQRRIVDLRNELSSVVLQFLTGISKLRIAGAEPKAFAIWADLFSDNRRLQYRSRQIFNAVAVFNRVFPMVVTLVIFSLSLSLVLESKELSMGHLLAFLAALTAFIVSITSMSRALSKAFLLIPLYEAALPILETVPEVDETKTSPGKLSGKIEMQHVSFRYEHDGPLILDDVSFSIEAGEFVALVGPSGSGKSTIFKLLIGFEEPESGSVYFDDQDLDGLDVRAVRRQLGVVVQNGKLMPGDIYENIAGASLITRDDAWDAARLADLDGDIRAMPMGMHTVISEGGGTLSGGQIQRLMIARAVVTKPQILLFDEATSALDNKTQAQISRSLERLPSTRIVIAHRLSTIRNADRILVLESGRVVERGSYEELMAQDGPFAELARRQMA